MRGAKFRVSYVNISILFFVLTYVKAEYNVEKFCQLVPIGTKFPSFKSCQTFYTCYDTQQVIEAKCPGNDIFDKDSQVCVPESYGNCKYGKSNPCEGLNDTWASDAKDCRLWHYCENGNIKGSGHCPKGQYFDGIKFVNGNCINENWNNEGEVTEIKDLCKIMQNNEFFGDFDDCSIWQKCSADKEFTKKHCPNELVYDVQKRMCLEYSKERCLRSGGIKPVKPITPTDPCNDQEKKGDKNNCSIYYECKDNKWITSKCPTNEYFDTIDQECKQRQKATPEEKCDRCLYAQDKWVNAVDEKCTNYFTCTNGQRINDDTGSCGENNYFNEQLQMCLIGTTTLADYSKNNGACKCGWECQLVKCENDETCKTNVCTNEKDLVNQINCKSTVCEADNDILQCKLNVCDNLTATDDDKVKCKFSACNNDGECKNKACETHRDLSEQVKCKQNLCENKQCKITACNDFINNNPNKVKCKLDVCEITDVNCPKDICDNYTQNENEKLHCNVGISEDKNEFCNQYSQDLDDILKCNMTICENDMNCKNKLCMDHSENEEEQIICKVGACGKDQNCKLDACKGHEVYDICS